MNRKYIIKLTEEERQHLEKLTSSGNTSARAIARAHILLKSDSSHLGSYWKYEQICKAFNVTTVTVMNIRKRFVENGLQATLYRKKPKREYRRALDGEAEAHLMAIACSEPPKGRKVWSLRLLRDRFIRLGFIDDISHETIRTTLKKRKSSPG
jgi:transposase